MGFLCRLDIHSWTKRPATLNAKRIVRRCKTCGRVSVVQEKAVKTVKAPETAAPMMSETTLLPEHAR